MIPKNFEEIIFEDIIQLIDNKVSESRTLDYKRSLPGNSDDDRKEFLADVSAFANASGGDIIYGIEEVKNADKQSTGIGKLALLEQTVNEDQEKLRLESCIRDGIKPRVPGIQIKFLKAPSSSGKICVIRIAHSWASPHMVTYKMRPAFFSRTSAGKFSLDSEEIRSAFTGSTKLQDNIREFRTNRVSKIITNDSFAALVDGSKVILHMLPVSAFTAPTDLGISKIKSHETRIAPIQSSGWNNRINMDGLLVTAKHQKDDANHNYVQMFRDGKIEAVATNLIGIRGTQKIIPYLNFEQKVIDAVTNYTDVLKSLDVQLPIVISLTLTSVKGFTIPRQVYFESEDNFLIDRDVLLSP